MQVHGKQFSVHMFDPTAGNQSLGCRVQAAVGALASSCLQGSGWRAQMVSHGDLHLVCLNVDLKNKDNCCKINLFTAE